MAAALARKRAELRAALDAAAAAHAAALAPQLEALRDETAALEGEVQVLTLAPNPELPRRLPAPALLQQALHEETAVLRQGAGADQS